MAVKESATLNGFLKKNSDSSKKIEDISLITCGLFFQDTICKFKTNKIGLKVFPGTFFRIGLSSLEAEICRFLWSLFAGYSL